MWGTDATSTVTLEEGRVTVFVSVDHCMLEGISLHAATRASRFDSRLKRLVMDLSLDKHILSEALRKKV